MPKKDITYSENGAHLKLQEPKSSYESGYRLFYRAMLKHPIVGIGKCFTKFEAWCYMLFLATGNEDGVEREIMVKNKPIKVFQKHGSFVCSQRGLAKKFGWSISKLRAFLKALSKENMVEIEPILGVGRTTQVTTQVATQISICKYSTYQGRTTHATTQVTTPVEYVLGIRSKKTIPSTAFTADTWQYKFSKRFYERSANAKKFKSVENERKQDFKNWSDAIDKLNRIDGYEQKQIADVLKFAIEDEFWQNNLISLSAIRKRAKNGLTKFENILASSQKQEKSKNPFVSTKSPYKEFE